MRRGQRTFRPDNEDSMSDAGMILYVCRAVRKYAMTRDIKFLLNFLVSLTETSERTELVFGWSHINRAVPETRVFTR